MQLLMHVANAMQRAEGVVLERSFSCFFFFAVIIFDKGRGCCSYVRGLRLNSRTTACLSGKFESFDPSAYESSLIV